MKPSSNTTQMKFFMENNEDNVLEDNKEVIHHEDREEDFLSSKVIKDIKVSREIKVTKVIKVIKDIKAIQTINKVTRGTHKEGINNVEIFEVNQILEATTNLVTRWIHVIMS